MRRNLNYIAALAISISVINGMINHVFAAETTNDNQNISSVILNDSTINGQGIEENQVITLDKVINAAISNSDKLALKSKQIEMIRNKMKLQEKTNDFYDSVNQTVYDFPYDKLELQEYQTDQEEEFLKAQISSDITNKYNTIIMKQIEINKLNTNLEIKTKELEIMKTKLRIGVAIANQLDDKQIEIKSLQDDIQAKENSLKNYIEYLEILTDLNLSNSILDKSISYDIFKIDSSVDEYLDKKLDEYFKYNNKMIELTKDYLEKLDEDGVKDIMEEGTPDMPHKNSPKYLETDDKGNTSFDYAKYAIALIQYQGEVSSFSQDLAAYGAYLDAGYNMDEAKIKLDDSKKSLKNVLKESYSTLLDLENKINALEEQVKSINIKLKQAKLQVDMGMMTENDYKAMALKSEDLDASLRNLINTYNNLKDSIQKPWILSSK